MAGITRIPSLRKGQCDDRLVLVLRPCFEGEILARAICMPRLSVGLTSRSLCFRVGGRAGHLGSLYRSDYISRHRIGANRASASSILQLQLLCVLRHSALRGLRNLFLNAPAELLAAL